MLAYNELVCGLNRPNAHSHPADLSVLISPKDAPSPRARVRHLCEEFFLLSLIESSFDLDKNNSTKFQNEHRDLKIFFLSTL